MKISIELSLRTREVHQLFQRKIDGDRLFVEAILHKFNLIMNQYRHPDHQRRSIYQQIEKKMQALTEQFSEELTRFESFLAKRKEFDNKKLDFIIQFKPTLIVTNPLTLRLIEFIEVYDRLIAMLKLLHLAGCFEADDMYYGNIKRIQKVANQGLSSLMLTSISCPIESS